MSYKHGEAYCLMKYVDEATGEVEWLWNSRDGVTPFGIQSRAGNIASHADWHEDVKAPNFVPPVGMRIFIDMTEAMKEDWARKRVEEYWDHPEVPMSQHPYLGPCGKEGAVKRLMESLKAGEPSVVEVTTEMHAEFKRLAEEAHRTGERLRDALKKAAPAQLGGVGHA